MFVDRQREVQFLNSLLTRTHPSAAQFVLLYGRRRVGKTTLLRHWAEQSQLPYTYWGIFAQPLKKVQSRISYKPYLW